MSFEITGERCIGCGVVHKSGCLNSTPACNFDPHSRHVHDFRPVPNSADTVPLTAQRVKSSIGSFVIGLLKMFLGGLIACLFLLSISGCVGSVRGTLNKGGVDFYACVDTPSGVRCDKLSPNKDSEGTEVLE